jgi:hypothetical protein
MTILNPEAAQTAQAKAQAYREAKRGINDALEWAGATTDVIRGVHQGYRDANGDGPAAHVLQQAVEHLGKSQRALERARSLVEVGLDVFDSH